MNCRDMIIMKTIRKIYKKIPECKIKNLISLFYNKKTRIQDRPKLPNYLQVELTTRCNLNCIMCMRNRFLNKRLMKLGDMTFENFQKILNKISSADEIHLQGMGEPFLNKDIFKIIKYAKSKGLRVILVTNGTLIGQLSDDIVESGLDLMKISFYGSNPETYEKIMKNSNFKKVVDNIKKINEAKKMYQTENPILEFNIGLMHENSNDLLKLPAILKELRIKKLNVGGIYNYGEQVVTSTKEISEIIGEIENKCKSYQIKTFINIPKDVCDFTKKCLYPWTATYITWDGFIKPCCFRPYFVDFNFGNILNQNFEDVWNGEKYIEFRKKIKSKDVPMMCKGCLYDFSVFDEKNKTTASK